MCLLGFRVEGIYGYRVKGLGLVIKLNVFRVDGIYGYMVEGLGLVIKLKAFTWL